MRAKQCTKQRASRSYTGRSASGAYSAQRPQTKTTRPCTHGGAKPANRSLFGTTSTRMHLRTHVRPEHRSPKGVTALTEYADGMIEHDGTVGSLLKALDDPGVVNNTIVTYTTDNGPHANSRPGTATTPFRSEKGTSWEGVFRVPVFSRRPGRIKADSISNEIVSGLDCCGYEERLTNDLSI